MHATTLLIAQVSLAAVAAAQATVTPLPPEVEALEALDRAGAAVLWRAERQPAGSQPTYECFVTEPGGALRVLARPASQQSLLATDLSADGAVAAGSAGDPYTPAWFACRWDLSVPTLLTGAPSNNGEGFGYAVSGDGNYVVGLTGLPREAARWDAAGAYVQLGFLPGTTTSTARGVSFDGRVVVGESGTRAFRWIQGVGMTDLGTPAGYSNAYATHVSDDGEVVLGVSIGASVDDRRLWRWTAAGGHVLLPRQPGSLGRQFAYDLSADGERVLGLDEGALGVLRPTMWEWDGRAVPLLNLAANHGLPSGSVVQFSGTRISGDGGVIAGFGQSTPGVWEALRLTLDRRAAIEATTCQASTPNLTGQLGALRIDGTPFAAANDLVLRAEALPPGAFTLFLTSPTAGQPTLPVGSHGTLCLVGQIGRYVRPGELQAATAAGTARLRLDLTDTPTSLGSVSVQAGSTWHYQAWHRDAAAGQPVSNFTSAGHINFQ